MHMYSPNYLKKINWFRRGGDMSDHEIHETKKKEDLKAKVEGLKKNPEDSLAKTLQLMLTKRDYENISLLLEYDPKLVNTELEGGWTALHYAMWENDEKLVDFLLERNGDVNVSYNNNHSAAEQVLKYAKKFSLKEDDDEVSTYINILHKLLNKSKNKSGVVAENAYFTYRLARRGGPSSLSLIDLFDSLAQNTKESELLNKLEQTWNENGVSLSDLGLKSIQELHLSKPLSPVQSLIVSSLFFYEINNAHNKENIEALLPFIDVDTIFEPFYNSKVEEDWQYLNSFLTKQLGLSLANKIFHQSKSVANKQTFLMKIYEEDPAFYKQLASTFNPLSPPSTEEELIEHLIYSLRLNKEKPKEHSSLQELLNNLVKKGFNVSAKTFFMAPTLFHKYAKNELSSLLYNAVFRENVELVKFLIENGADLDAKRTNKESDESYDITFPIIYCSEAKQKEMLSILGVDEDFPKKYKLLKAIGHKLGLSKKFTVKLKNIECLLDPAGLSTVQALELLISSFESNTSFLIAHKEYQMLVDAMSATMEALGEEYDTELLARFKNDQVTWLIADIPKHTVGIALWGNKLFYTNRGQGRNNNFSSQVFEIDPSKVSALWVSNFQNMSDIASVNKFIDDVCINPGESVDQKDHGSQKWGTCSFANNKSMTEMLIREIFRKSGMKEQEIEKAAEKLYKQATTVIRDSAIFDLMELTDLDPELGKQVAEALLESHHDANKPHEIERANRFLRFFKPEQQKNIVAPLEQLKKDDPEIEAFMKKLVL